MLLCLHQPFKMCGTGPDQGSTQIQRAGWCRFAAADPFPLNQTHLHGTPTTAWNIRNNQYSKNNMTTFEKLPIGCPIHGRLHKLMQFAQKNHAAIDKNANPAAICGNKENLRPYIKRGASTICLGGIPLYSKQEELWYISIANIYKSI